jgi:PAS domain S-box-containing protein
MSRTVPSHAINAARFKALAHALAEIVWITGADGQAEDLPEWRAYTGQTADEVRGWGWLDALHPDDRDGARAAWDVAIATTGAKPYDVEYRVRAADGGYRWFSARGVPVLDAGGAVREWVGVCADVEDRKRSRAERDLLLEELERERERLRATFDQAAVGIGHVGMDGTWLRVNQQLCEILGRPCQELTRLTFQEITHPDDLAEDLELVERLLAGDIDHYSIEKRYLRGDGGTVWARLTVALVRSPDGSPEYFISVVQDISQHKDAEERLRGAERHLRAVIDAMFAFVGVTTPDGILIEANRAALEAADLEPEDVLGRPFEDAYWWSYDPAVQRRLREAIDRAAAGEASRYDVIVRLGPDRFEPIDFIIAPLYDEDGRVTHLVPSAMVITERVEAEEAVRESEARFRALADNISQLAWMTDAEGWIFWYNRRWFEYTGTTLEEMEGWGWQKVHHPDHLDRVVERFRGAVASGEPWEDTFPLRGRDGEYRWFLSRAHPIRDEEGKVSLWFGTNTDITADREAATERERLLEEVRAASAAKSDFMAVMSHELRTPLNAIIGYTDLLEMGVPTALPDGARATVERIRRAASHQRQLIDDILTFSRLDAGQEEVEDEVVPLQELLDEIDAVIAPLAARNGLELRIVADGSREIRTDPRKLRQILVNLLGNAVKFTRAGRVELRVEEEPECFRIVVEDTGVGMVDVEAARVFDPFWQAERGLTRTAGGSGLGLSISQRFARLLGGEISVESEKGRGSRFTLTLPRPSATDPGPS